MLKLLKYLKGYRKYALITPLMILLEAVCELLMPKYMSSIIDDGINAAGGGNMNVILVTGGKMILLCVGAVICGIIVGKASSIAVQGFGYNLRKAMFGKISELSFADIDRFSSASLITRITNDVNVIQQMVNMGLRMLVRAPAMLIFAIVICFGINVRLTVILVVAVPVLAISVATLMNICRKLFDTMQKKIDGLNQSVQENLIAIRVVKAFVREKHEKEKFRRANDDLTNAAINVVTKIVLMMPIMMTVLHVAMVCSLWFGGKYVLEGSFLTGELYSFISYISTVLISIMMLSMILLNVARARACADRINEVLETIPDITDTETEPENGYPGATGAVAFENVSFKYAKTGTGDDVLNNISFSVAPGSFVAIVGGTGVGKSSLVNLIPRFYDVTGGSVKVDGLDVRSYGLDELRSRIGMVLQNNVLFSGTVRENMLWGKEDASDEEIAQALKNAMIYDTIMSFPEGLDTMLDQGGVNLSGGQKQRLCIARAMLRKPAILILDDSTSAVDSATEAEIRKSFQENLDGTTVIIIAQRISSVRYADSIIVLEDDHIAGMGTHDELLSSCDVYKEIYDSQQEGVSE
ncbi:MAG: ABC transporter ATP-binding protein/permease [Oscillospiraceae bacterium]|nr:ABC transporter ATP-binding protein/permease [Oscillospiraceae bacterium]